MAKILIPTPLRKFTENQASVEIHGTNIREAIQDLTNRFGSLKPHLLDDHGNIRSFIRVYVGDEDINALQKEATQVSDSEIISIVPAIAGG